MRQSKSAPVFAAVANNKEASVANAEEALYYEADCQRLQGNYSRAAEVYNLLLGSYPMGKHAQQARKRLFDIASAVDFSTRLPAVHRALYLLFNEGYHGACAESAVRVDLCREAMRLAAILLDHPLGKTPATYALSALMCMSMARLPARVDAAGNLNALFNQDRSQWDHGLVVEGLKLLELSASGSELSEYHVEAAIASVHATATRTEDTDWGKIVSLYDALTEIHPSPIVALNRAIAVAQRDGPERGLETIRAIPDSDRLATYPFYYAALGELELRGKRHQLALQHFNTALTFARNPTERRFLAQRVAACEVGLRNECHL